LSPANFYGTRERIIGGGEGQLAVERVAGSWRGLQITVCLLAAVLVLLLAGEAYHFWLFLYLPGKPDREVRQVLVSPGMGAAAIAQLLYAEGVVANEREFYWLCSLRRIGSRLKAGEYAFSPLSTPAQVLDRLVQGDVIKHRIALPEGISLRNVVKLLAGIGWITEQDLLRLVRDKNYIRSLGLDAASLEGYLFPDTYYFERTQDASKMLETMVKGFWRHYPEAWRERAREQGLTVHEVMTLASMVEKEARVDAERPLIAAVFLNRLQSHMPLQSDPTAVYDLADFTGPVTAAHLQRQSPYNTYLHKGLPPGPICSPGVKSIRAVLYPENVPYLYFVSNNDGTHHFSTTLAEHNTAVQNYRRRLKDQTQRAGPASDPFSPVAPTRILEPPDAAINTRINATQ
jgi:UPF0755 protein